MSLWETIEKKYFKKTAAVTDPHWFAKSYKNITSDDIFNVYNNMSANRKGVTGDSE